MLNRIGTVLVIVTAIIIPAVTQEIQQEIQDVIVDVRLVRAGSGERLTDSSRAVVWLVPLNPSAHQAPTSNKHYRMVQRDKHFEPNLLVIPVGSSVDFPNLDPWFHNVFSLYRGKRFDLGLYQAGSTRSVRFDRLGASYLFCNIHPQMSAVILTVDSDWFGISGKDGRVEIRGVPPGAYRMRFWDEQASAETLDALERRIVLPGADAAQRQVVIAVREESRAHKNKYGQDYDPDTLTPNY